MCKKAFCFLLILLLSFSVSFAFAEDHVLNIWGLDEDCRYYYAAEKFAEKYPDITLQLAEDYGSGSNLINRLFSRDQSIDIVAIQDWNNGVSGRFLATSGLLENLNDDPELLAIREEMNAINDPFILDDAWFGVNNWTKRWIWYGNTALFQQLGLDMPAADWNWDDFFALGKQVYEYNQANGTTYKLIYEDDMSPYVVKQFLYNTTDYVQGTHQLRDERFRELVSQWLQLREWGVSMNVDDDQTYRDMRTALPDTLINVQLTSFYTFLTLDPQIEAGSEEALYKLLTPPAENGMHASLCRMFGAGVTTYSDLKEEALYFLELYISKEAYINAESFVLLNSTKVGEVCSPFFYDGPLYKNDPMLASLQLPENAWITENINHWVAMMNDSEGEYYDPDMARTICLGFEHGLIALKNGEITLDEYIQNCCRIADQYLGE